MIKVIACDMDGTLLADDHTMRPRTLDAVRRACGAGIRFMIVTGRNYEGALEELHDVDFACDYIVGSGAEVRGPDGEKVLSIRMPYEKCEKVYDIVKDYDVYILFMTDFGNYQIGTPEAAERGFARHMRLFFLDMDEEEMKNTKVYQRMSADRTVVPDLETLKRSGIPVYKMFLSSEDQEALDRIAERLEKVNGIAAASSFSNNLEITDEEAQKGPVLKKYIESLGYTMDEVMVFGDSMNDYSMLSMDFGATVAMANAVPKVKRVSKYITRSNEDFGVAYAIDELLKRQGQRAACCEEGKVEKEV